MEIQENNLKLIKNQSSSYNMKISALLEDKIRFLCAKFPSTEWSGVLFWTKSGEFGETNFKLEAVDLLLMDIGTATTTAFKMTPKVASYMTENDLLKCQLGLIHSHQSFSTFFSGTDLDTLKVEGKDRIHFLSLIVNNEGKYCAAITRKAEIEDEVVSNVKYLTFNNLSKNAVVKNKINYTAVEYFNINIEYNNSIFNEILKDINEISESKKAEVTHETNLVGQNYNTAPIYNGQNLFNQNYNTKPDYPSLFPEYDKLSDAAIIEDEDLDKELEDIADSIIYQLITGDVLISNSINIDHYIKSGQMNNKLNKRFSDFKDFTSYAESMIDFIYEDYDLWTSYEIPDIIVKRLSKWENNKYIKVIVELFKKYSLQYE